MATILIDSLGPAPRIGGVLLLMLAIPALFTAPPIGVMTLVAGLIIVGFQRSRAYDPASGRLIRSVGWGPWRVVRASECGALLRLALGRPMLLSVKLAKGRRRQRQVWPLGLEAEQCSECIIEAKSADEARRRGERLARLLRLPLLDRRSDPPAERDWQDLDRPAWQRLTAADKAPPPSAAIARCEDLRDGLSITLPMDVRLLWQLALPVLAGVPVVIISASWMDLPWFTSLVIGLILLPVLVQAGWMGLLHGRLARRLQAGPDGVRLGLLHLPRDAIEEVIVAEHHRRHRLDLISDRRRIVLDRGLPPDELAWLRWRILAALADRGGSAG